MAGLRDVDERRSPGDEALAPGRTQRRRWRLAWTGAGWLEPIQGHLITDSEISDLAAQIDS